MKLPRNLVEQVLVRFVVHCSVAGGLVVLLLLAFGEAGFDWLAQRRARVQAENILRAFERQPLYVRGDAERVRAFLTAYLNSGAVSGIYVDAAGQRIQVGVLARPERMPRGHVVAALSVASTEEEGELGVSLYQTSAELVNATLIIAFFASVLVILGGSTGIVAAVARHAFQLRRVATVARRMNAGSVVHFNDMPSMSSELRDTIVALSGMQCRMPATSSASASTPVDADRLLIMVRLAAVCPVPLIVVRGDKAIWANPAFSATFGWSNKELRRVQAHSLFPETEFSASAFHSIETKIARSDGTVVDIQLHGERVSHQGADSICLAAVPRAGAPSANNAAKGEEASLGGAQFMAVVTHELRTLLNGITGMTELLSATHLDAEQQEHLSTLRSHSRQLRHLIDDLLDLAKVEQGRLTLESIEFNLHQQLKPVLQSYAAIARKKSLYFESDLPAEAVVVIGDPYRLRQVLTNLLDNALKFTAKGGIRVKVELRNGAPRHGPALELVVTVSDTGIGIPEEVQGRLFAPYSQAGGDTWRYFGGTGLGLALCRQLCLMMGGSICVNSVDGEGATFKFTASVAPGSNGAPVFQDTSPSVDLGELQASIQGARILVVDDNKTNQKLLCRWLEMAGALSLTADNGREAVATVLSCKVDAVLMDVSMPVMNGFEATREIRRQAAEHEHLRRLPIVGVTAFAMPEDRQACLSVGMVDHISKPIRRNDFLRTLAKHLEVRRTAVALVEPAVAPIRLDD